ncbi:hypothetical protein CRENBAI_007410 [Crenichthys baileyi]|uniref:Uncharacterized protein n=1 Tax=Crenichthys baileyi TaxID=28760 RepID=A0AAV9RGA7_9TELE
MTQLARAQDKTVLRPNEFLTQPHEPPNPQEPQHEFPHRTTPNQDTFISNTSTGGIPLLESSTSEKPMKIYPYIASPAHSPSSKHPRPHPAPYHTVRWDGKKTGLLNPTPTTTGEHYRANTTEPLTHIGGLRPHTKM